MSTHEEEVKILEEFSALGFKLVMWPENGDSKGPLEAGWPQNVKTPQDWQPGLRVGVLTGTQLVAADEFGIDIDIDWKGGQEIAKRLLPMTGLVFGHGDKTLSHAFYTCPVPVPSKRFDNIDGTCLLEIRGTKTDGTIGLQTMIPPSVWSKEGQREPLKFGQKHWSTKIGHFVSEEAVNDRARLIAATMLLGYHLGHHGFGHEVRLAWAGTMLRLKVKSEALEEMGKALSAHCSNTELADIAVVIASTAKSLEAGKKSTGGPELAKLIGPSGKAVIARLNEWYKPDSGFVLGDKARIIAEHEGNIRRAITLMGYRPRRHEFTEKFMLFNADDDKDEGRFIDDAVFNGLWLQLQRDFGMKPSKDYFLTVLGEIADKDSYHALREWLDDLKWDGIDRINTWLTRLAGAIDTPYSRAVQSIPLIAAVRRARKPGCKYDEMLVLESSQGLNKSSALRMLCPKDDWFSDDLPLDADSKRIIEMTLGKWIIEASDLAGKRKTEVEQLKAMLSRQIDGPARMAYAKMSTERARQSIIVGTTNSRGYLADMTGARRFWPLEVGKFDLERLAEERDQLWAEAAYREAEGESIRLPEALWPAAGEEQEKRREIDPWEEDIEAALEGIEPSADGLRRIPTANLWNVIQVTLDRRNRAASMRVAEIMTRLGYYRTTIRVEGVNTPGYRQKGD